MSGEKEHAGLGDRFKKVAHARMSSDVHVIPVVQAGAADAAIGQAETKRTNEVEGRPRGRAESSDVAGVRRDFGFDEDNVHGEMVDRGSHG